MDQFFTKEFSNGPFVLFSVQHIIAICVILLVNISFLYFRRRSDEAFQRKFRRWFRVSSGGHAVGQ